MHTTFLCITTTITYLVSLTETLLENVSTIWLDIPFDQKLRFQTLLFPKGVYYQDKNIRTSELGLPFALISSLTSKKSTLARPEGQYTQFYELANQI